MLLLVVLVVGCLLEVRWKCSPNHQEGVFKDDVKSIGGRHFLDFIFSLKGEVFKVHGPRGYIKSPLVYYTLLQLASAVL